MNFNELSQAIARTKTDLTSASAQLEKAKGEHAALEEKWRLALEECGLGPSSYLNRLLHSSSMLPPQKPQEIIQIEQEIKEKSTIIKNLQGVVSAYSFELDGYERQYKELTTAQDPNSPGVKALQRLGYNASSFRQSS